MQAVDDGVVLRTHADPDVVEIDFAGEFADDRQDFDHLGRVGRHFGKRNAVGQLRRRSDVEAKRDVLREVVAGVRELVLADVGAELVAGVLRLGRGLNGGVDLIADLLANGLRTDRARRRIRRRSARQRCRRRLRWSGG